MTTIAAEVLNDLSMSASMIIEIENVNSAYYNVFIPVSKSVTVFAEAQINSIGQAVYFVTSSKNKSASIPALNYKQAVSKLQLLLA